jgi:glycosyltransferase involved in cell wall biosynthesis
MGESALYVDDPLDPEAFAMKVNELIEDTELEKKLLESGKRILEAYTLGKFREKMQAIYEEILKKK